MTVRRFVSQIPHEGVIYPSCPHQYLAWERKIAGRRSEPGFESYKVSQAPKKLPSGVQGVCYSWEAPSKALRSYRHGPDSQAFVCRSHRSRLGGSRRALLCALCPIGAYADLAKATLLVGGLSENRWLSSSCPWAIDAHHQGTLEKTCLQYLFLVPLVAPSRTLGVHECLQE